PAQRTRRVRRSRGPAGRAGGPPRRRTRRAAGVVVMSRPTAAAPLPDPGVRADRVVRTNGGDLAVEAFGVPGDRAVLLVAGAVPAMAGWPDELCALISAGRRFVVRYDHRDTGRSVTYPAGVPPYTLRDLVADAVGLLDVLDVRRAHLVGVSMGGMIVQLAALDHAERVESMTLLSTSPGGPGPDRPGGPELPPTPLSVRVEIDDVTWPDWSDRGSVIEHLVALARPRAGRARPFDEPRHRELAPPPPHPTAALLP